MDDNGGKNETNGIVKVFGQRRVSAQPQPALVIDDDDGDADQYRATTKRKTIFGKRKLHQAEERVPVQLDAGNVSELPLADEKSADEVLPADQECDGQEPVSVSMALYMEAEALSEIDPVVDPLAQEDSADRDFEGSASVSSPIVSWPTWIEGTPADVWAHATPEPKSDGELEPDLVSEPAASLQLDVEFEEEQVSPLDNDPTEDLLHLLREKVEEFTLLGYGTVSASDLWSYFQTRKKRRPKSLHELVNAILCLQPQTYMNFTMQQVYVHSSEPFDPAMWQDLLAAKPAQREPSDEHMDEHPKIDETGAN